MLLTLLGASQIGEAPNFSVQAKDAKSGKDHCYALVLGGGGTRGAYEAGVFWGLLHGITEDQRPLYAYDVVSGVSAGTINGAALSIFEIGDEFNASNVLSDYWQTLTTSNIYKRWFPFGLVTGLDKTGMVNTAPLRDFMKTYFDAKGHEMKRSVSFLGVDAVTGNALPFNETLSDDDMINAAMTSSAVPFAFPDQQWSFDGRDIVGIDGGAAWGIDIGSAIKRCQEIVDDDSKITVDVVSCNSNQMPSYSGDEPKHTVDNFIRFMELKNYHDGVSDVAELMAAFPKVNFRHYIEPTQTLPTMSMMDGTNSTCTWPMQELGRLDAAHALGKEGFIFSKV